MKIAIVAGRGADGCGCTGFIIQQYRWYKKHGFEVRNLIVDDKTWTRKKSHLNDGFEFFKLVKAPQAENFSAALQEADIVIVNSLPSVGHPEKCISEFYRALDMVKKTVVLVQHDHASLSIKRNARIEDAIKKATVIFGHSKTSDFAKLVTATTENGLASMFDESDDQKEILNFQPGMDFDSIRKEYWKDIEEQDVNLHRWVGRTTSWKGYFQMFKFHNEFLKGFGAKTAMEGIERSPAYLGFKDLSPHHSCLTENPDTFEMVTDTDAYVFGPFNNNDMLHRMSKSGFGYQLSTLDQKFIQRSIEYTHCEIACTGVIPVFRKSYGERCTHRVTGDRLIAAKNSGTIWLDDNDMQPAFDLVKKLTNDSGMRAEWREMAFEYYKQHQNSEDTFSEMHNQIMKAIQ